jgi:hypothetical protein
VLPGASSGAVVPQKSQVTAMDESVRRAPGQNARAGPAAWWCHGSGSR